MSTPSVPARTPIAAATLPAEQTSSTLPATPNVAEVMVPATPLAARGKSEMVALPYTLLMIAVVCMAIGALKSRGNRR